MLAALALSLAASVWAAPVAAVRPVEPLRLIIAGPPASSKGTNADRLVEEFGVVKITVSDLLSAHVAATDDQVVAAQMEKGELVDSGLVLRLLAARFSQDDVRQRGYVLDGSPRRPEEVEGLRAILSGELAPHGVVHLNAPDEELRRRSRVRGRKGETDKVFDDRLSHHRTETVPALADLARTARFVEVDVSSQDREANWERVRAAVASLFDGSRP
ncbi:MAG TPA: nucleoside monophosphate kinase [Elusimicrobiota bacterium]|jgi:adenylate kinase|nr:nucleoside monophosphate kinase [Elusimicrobiota bacterium]